MNDSKDKTPCDMLRRQKTIFRRRSGLKELGDKRPILSRYCMAKGFFIVKEKALRL